MPQYVLRDIPSGLWTSVKARATRESRPLRALILQLLEDYATERSTLGAASPAASDDGGMWRGAPRLAVVQFKDGRIVRIPGAGLAHDDGSELVLLDRSARPLARIPRVAIFSWYFEEQQPAT